MKKLSAFLFSLLASAASYGGVFNQFGPATGILKGSTTTPITTAATWSDVTVLLSGTCNSSVFVRADGSCLAVDLTANVTGTLPVANGGTGHTSLAALTKSDDTNVTLTLGGSPTTALANAASITAGWTGTLAATRGGLGMSTVTDDTVAVANGTTWQSKAIADCDDSGGSHLNYDTTTNAFTCGTSSSGSTVTPAALTRTDDTNVTLTLGGTPATALLQATSITAGWTGTLAAARGGLGMSTVTDDTVAVANGSAWQSKAIGDCDDTSGNHLNYDTGTNAFTCGTSSSVTAPAAANPTGLIGMSAVNGSAITFTRSDGHSAIDPAITPTWSGRHIFTSAYSSGFGLQVNNATPGMEFYDNDATANTGKWVFDDTTGNNFCMSAVPDNYATFRTAMCAVRSAAAIADVNFGNTTDNPTFSFKGTGVATISGAVVVAGATGGSQGTGTVNATNLFINGVPVIGGATTTSTFNLTFTGVSGTVTCAMKYRLVGSTVFLFNNSGSSCTGTSTAGTFTMTGLPAAIQPSRAIEALTIGVDNGAASTASASISSGGSVITMFIADVSSVHTTFGAGWTAAGSKGLAAGWGLVYDLGN